MPDFTRGVAPLPGSKITGNPLSLLAPDPVSASRTVRCGAGALQAHSPKLRAFDGGYILFWLNPRGCPSQLPGRDSGQLRGNTQHLSIRTHGVDISPMQLYDCLCHGQPDSGPSGLLAAGRIPAVKPFK